LETVVRRQFSVAGPRDVSLIDRRRTIVDLVMRQAHDSPISFFSGQPFTPLEGAA
jgi:hypothetical protein